MKKIIMCLLVLLLIPSVVLSETTRKVVEKYPPLNPESTLTPNPKTTVYLDSKGNEIAKELCDETGKAIETFGKIPDGMVKEYFESGALLAEYNYKGGKLEGTSKGYYENGAFRGEWNYKKGKLDGKIKVYHVNGKLHYELNYKNGKRDGISKYYNEDGILMYEWSHKDDKLEGTNKGYYENGKLSKEYNYKDDEREGVSKEYHRSGELKSEKTYKNGQLISQKEYVNKDNSVSEKAHPVEEKKEK